MEDNGPFPPREMQTIADLRNYLLFLRENGYTEIPVEPEGKFAAAPSAEIKYISEPQRDREGQTDVSRLLQDIRDEMGDCKRCKLCENRTNIVFGSGNPGARLVFVGEGPGADEDEQGLPFVGRAGKKLTEIIEKGMGLNRERDTYICNIVKCRPPGNRDPETDEIAACKPFLEKQLAAIAPKVIVALGKPAASTLLGRSVAITKERGTWHSFNGIKLMLTYHPAFLLRAYTLENRRAVLEDMKKALAELNS